MRICNTKRNLRNITYVLYICLVEYSQDQKGAEDGYAVLPGLTSLALARGWDRAAGNINYPWKLQAPTQRLGWRRRRGDGRVGTAWSICVRQRWPAGWQSWGCRLWRASPATSRIDLTR